MEENGAVELESLPESAAMSSDDGGLPQDETLLDLGGAGMGKKVRQAIQEREAANAARASAEESEASEEANFEEAPAKAEASAEPESEQAPVESEGEPESLADGDPDKPKKKGLFGKLFGRKK